VKGKEKFLLVDDDPVFRRDLEAALPAWIRLGVQSSAFQALEEVLCGRCAAILIAHVLTDTNGIELVQKVRVVAPRLPIVLVTQSATSELILDALHLGVCDVIQKPANGKAIDLMLSRLIMEMEQACCHTTLDSCEQRKKPFAKWQKIQPLGEYLRQFDTDVLYRSFLIKIKTFLKKHFHPLPPPADMQNYHLCELPQDKNNLFNVILRINFLGSFTVEVNGRPLVDWPGHKAKLLFAYMAYHHKRRTYRDILMDKFWPHSTPDSARNCLNVTLHSIRSALQKICPGPEFILFKDECYFFSGEVQVVLDTDQFIHSWQLAQRAEEEKNFGAALDFLEAAAALYKGDFLEEFLYEGWTELERENLSETYLVLLDKISGYYAMDGRPATAISLCEQILQKDNCREEVYRRLMICYNRIGQRDKALRVFKRCLETLKTTLDVDPTAATRDLCQKIREEKSINR
jgi:two-component SAPR family response regulator